MEEVKLPFSVSLPYYESHTTIVCAKVIQIDFVKKRGKCQLSTQTSELGTSRISEHTHTTEDDRQ